MDELRVRLLIESIKALHTIDDYDLREAFKKELAKQFDLLATDNGLKREIEIREEHFDKLIEKNDDLKEALYLAVKSII